jgi:DNA-binding NarL/FixJ family response regulator
LQPPKSQTRQRTRVLLAEDDALMRYSVRRLVEQSCEVIDEACDGGTAVELAEELRPDVVVLDISMPVLNGLEAARRLKERLPEVRIIVLSNHSERAYVEEAFRLGAESYVVKGPAMFQLPQAIDDALNGRRFRSA